MEAILFIGIPASGKSAFYKERFFDTHVRINLDMLKTRRRETLILKACLASKQPFVHRQYQCAEERPRPYIEQARSAGFRVVGYYFQSRLQDALERNRRRKGKASIREKGLIAKHRQLANPCPDEGFDQLFYVMMARTTRGSWSRSGTMKFDDLDAKMRVFETASDTGVLPGLYMAARIDGRSFTRLTKEVTSLRRPMMRVSAISWLRPSNT